MPAKIENGDLSCTSPMLTTYRRIKRSLTSYPEGTICQVSCNERSNGRYEKQVERKSVCLSDGKWSVDLGKCCKPKVLQCVSMTQMVLIIFQKFLSSKSSSWQDQIQHFLYKSPLIMIKFFHWNKSIHALFNISVKGKILYDFSQIYILYLHKCTPY